jgi:GT2 family glycosyltransferase
MNYITDERDSSTYTPLVSIVLLVYNGEKYIQECAFAVKAQSYSHIEVVVVDNASTDRGMQILKSTYPDWIYIQHKDNLGFAAGMNAGIEIARGEYVVPLNQDVYLDKYFIDKSVNIMRSLNGAGVLGGEEYLWECGKLTDELRTSGSALFLRLSIKGVWMKIASSTAKSFGVNGSFPFLRGEALVEVKSLDGHVYDPAFFSGWEDMDLWWRMQLRGWECFATQETKAWHVGSSFDAEKQSFLKKSTFYQGWVMRNRWLMILKNIPLFLLLFLSPFLLLLEFILPFYFLLISPRSLRAWLNSWREIFVSLPAIFEKRRIIQRDRKLSTLQIMRWFKAI